MRRYNQRLYRVALSILRDPAEAEDVIQDAYVRAYQHLDQFAGHAAFSTWLTRIAVNQALHRLKLRRRDQQMVEFEADEEESMKVTEPSLDPEQRASVMEVGRLLEEAVLELPGQYRSVIMLRDVEELSTAETAAALELTEENVKTRLHRGRAMMRDLLYARVGTQGKAAFPFMGPRCDQVVRGVLARLQEMER
jgi:RNA polymerase sigma-70 factor (ECF subfamily)